MRSLTNAPWLSPEQYLDGERLADIKSEYFDGNVYAMAGASEKHVSICTNLIVEAGGRLREKSRCKIYGSDMKVWIPATRSFVYPDLSVACGPPKMRDEHRDVLENPIAIFEVLSPSTEKYDRTLKFDGYCAIPGFQQYVLISQEQARVEVFTRHPQQGLWAFTRATGLESMVDFTTLEISIPLASIYDRIEF